MEEKIKELEQKCEEYLNNWKRAAADLVNYKKEEIERMATLMQYGKEGMIKKFLPIIDGVYYAARLASQASSAGRQSDDWVKGLEQVWQQAMEFLKKEGVEEIVIDGKDFNPEFMESIGESETGELQEVQKGYMIHGKVLRPAKVRIKK